MSEIQITNQNTESNDDSKNDECNGEYLDQYFGANVIFTSFKKKLKPNFKYIKYMIYGRELCPTTKRPHLQGYVILHRRDFHGKKIQEIIGDPVVSIRRANKPTINNQIYCSKDNDFFEYKDPNANIRMVKRQINKKDQIKGILTKVLKDHDNYYRYLEYLVEENIEEDVLLDDAKKYYSYMINYQ